MIIINRRSVMCGISGFCTFRRNYLDAEGEWKKVAVKMNRLLKHRGPDDEGVLITPHLVFAHVRLSIIDLKTGAQPITKYLGGKRYHIVYNGELYNMHELREGLKMQGYTFETASDTEVVLTGFVHEGADFVKRMNGIFAFAVYDEQEERLFLVRDHIGIKPLFYREIDSELVFASELKALFSHPKVKPEINSQGICEIFGIGPARIPGSAVFKGVHELKPGTMLCFDSEGIREQVYWRLEYSEHADTFEETLEKTRYLITDSVTKQMISDIPISTFLSGGVDSSLVTAICAEKLKEQGKKLNTFSFDFDGNDEFFKSNAFQPERDRPYVDVMVKAFDVNHRYLECNNEELADYLYPAYKARDLPGMADVDASMLYFCREVAEYNKVTLTGECADEIFGGYPWFHKPELIRLKTFPWSPSLEPRLSLLKDSVIKSLPFEEVVNQAYTDTINDTPLAVSMTEEEKQRRRMSYLNLKWFMMTLIERMDRMSMASGLEARVPFADVRIIEYIYNVPWDMKCPDGIVKGLLRKACEGILPSEILYRRKSPYPKTYNPGYENILRQRLRKLVEDKNAPVMEIVDRDKVLKFLAVGSDYVHPWYGQLMAGPQMMAYILQVDYFLRDL